MAKEYSETWLSSRKGRYWPSINLCRWHYFMMHIYINTMQELRIQSQCKRLIVFPNTNLYLTIKDIPMAM